MAVNHLHIDAVTPELSGLLGRLMQEPALASFNLAGGTALGLLLGHRRSIDIDLFTDQAFEATAISETLCRTYALSETITQVNSLSGIIEGIKVDILAHRYAIIDQVINVDGIRIFGLKDLGAMKLNAITNRGSKKDFWDCATLLQGHSMKEMLDWYSQKYPQASLWQVQKSMCYFDDAENEPDPVSLNNLTWQQVKTIISQNAQL